MKSSRKTARRASLRGLLKFLIVVFSLCCISLPRAPAQETTLHSQSTIVLVPALVKDAQGGIVYGLEAKNFAVEDDGVAQAVRLDEVPEGQAVSLVVVIQRGRRASYEFPRMRGLTTMLGPLFETGKVRVSIVEFDSRVELTREFTDDPSLIAADLHSLQPGDDGAAILDAVAYAIRLLKEEPDGRERVLLLISETRDHGSHTKIEDSVAAIGQINATMYALAFSPALSNILDTGRGNNQAEMHQGVDFIDLAYRTVQAMRKNVPSTMAAMTGGEYELFASQKKFDFRMNDFTNHLHSRYLLSFVPKSPHAGMHQLRVHLNDAGDATVLARTSYWVEGEK